MVHMDPLVENRSELEVLESLLLLLMKHHPGLKKGWVRLVNV